MSDSKKARRSKDTSPVRFYEGRMLIQAANLYRGLLRSLLESVQNALDADASRIFIGVNQKLQTAVVLDNGEGADRDRFETALLSVGMSIKPGSKLGRFGFGLVSPTTECATYTFTSWPTSDNIVRRWTFRESDIVEKRQNLRIPCETLDVLPSMPEWAAPYATDTFAVGWRTIIRLDQIKLDRTSSAFDPDEFDSQVRARFSQVMRQTGALVRLVFIDRKGATTTRDINPTAYLGEPLDSARYEYPDTGVVEFTLYRAPETPSGQRRGEIVVMRTNDNTAITLDDFVRQARGRRWAKGLQAAIAALSSGYFEGVITCEKIELDPERSKLLYDDALQYLYLVIEQWYNEVGQHHFESERVQTREARWLELSRKSQAWLRKLLTQPQHRALWEELIEALPSLDTNDGEGDSLSIKPNANDTPRPPREPGGSGSSAKQRRSQPPPSETGGPSVADSQQPHRNAGGLRLEHRILTSSVRLWEFDFQTGVLTFNVRHPVWERLEETEGRHEARNARWIVELQGWLVIQLLTLLLRHPDPEEFEQHRGLVDDQVNLIADWIVDRAADRGRPRKESFDEEDEF